MGEGNAIIANNTIVDNGGTGIHVHSDSVIANNIVAFQAGPGISGVESVPPTASHNCIYGNTPDYEDVPGPGTANGSISNDPLFCSRTTRDYHLTASSPCINAGHRESLDLAEFGTDLDGQDRSSLDGVDMGAYQSASSNGSAHTMTTAIDARLASSGVSMLTSVPSNIICVSGAHGNDNNDGTSWPAAKATVQAGLTAAGNSQTRKEVWVAAGIYSRSQGQVIPSGVKIYGGFAGYPYEVAETVREDRRPREHETVLVGSSSGSTVSSGSGGVGSVIDGFTIKGGGWGITVSSSAITVSNNRIYGNAANIGCNNSTSKIHSNLITPGSYSGGISINPYTNDQSLITNNTIIGKTNAIVINGSTTVVSNNIITGQSGNGVRVNSGSPTVEYNCVHETDPNNAYYNITPTSGITSDPLFVDTSTSPDYHLQLLSPCIDTGSDTRIESGWTDMDGTTRLQGSHVDMGAYESDPSPKFDRGLPANNGNINADGANRSNIKWASSDPNIFYGDDFTLPAGNWKIDMIRVWAIPTVPGYTSYALGDHFSSVTLYTGGTTGSLTAKTGSLSVGSSIASPSDIRIAPVTYPNGDGYKRATGEFDQIWQIDFSNLNWHVSGGDTCVFGLCGQPRVDRLCFNAAANAALSGWPTGAGDDHIRQFKLSDGATTLINFQDSQTGHWFGYDGNGNPKGSDINVQVFAHSR